MALVPVVLILVPLAALILGVSGQASEPGSEPFLFGQPVSRATVLVGRWLGESVALVTDEEIDRMIQADVLASEKAELGKLDALESEIAKELGATKQKD